MSDLLTQCTICRGLLDEEDLFCPNCGTEAPERDSDEAPSSRVSTYNFRCDGCGATMSYDASVQALRCPFCGSERLKKQPDKKAVAPEGVVPFQVDRDKAIAIMRQWLGRGFWRPSDLSESAVVVALQAVYVPYWVFEATTHSFWTADTSRTPAGARGDWYPMSGEHRGAHRGLLVAASSVLTLAETQAISPFELNVAVAPDEIDLENATVEQFGVLRRIARPIAIEGLEGRDSQACSEYVPGKCRNLKVNLRVEGLSSKPMLLPVWVLAYRYREQVHRFLINGQTGKASGHAPTSWRKIAAAVAIVAAIVALIASIVIASQ